MEPSTLKTGIKQQILNHDKQIYVAVNNNNRKCVHQLYRYYDKNTQGINGTDNARILKEGAWQFKFSFTKYLNM